MIDHNRLLNAADHLISVTEAIDDCPNCFPDQWCLPHVIEHQEALNEIRIAIGRQSTKKHK